MVPFICESDGSRVGLRPGTVRRIASSVGLASLGLVILFIAGLGWVAARESSVRAAAWKRHHDFCLSLPEEMYHKDRSRAVRGRVLDHEGKPVAGGIVRCIGVTALVRLAQAGPPAPPSWSGLVETATQTDAEGRYEFPYLSVGGRTICVSAPGLAPAVQSLIVVQDGAGARIDVTLEAPETLRVRLRGAEGRPRRIHLVPHRWWPELVAHDTGGSESEAEFSGLGGPFRKGLVLVSDVDDPSSWKVSGAFDLDRSRDVTVSCAGDSSSPLDVAEAACVAPWRPGVSEASRSFFGMLSPVALYWPTTYSPESSVLWHVGRRAGTGGGLRGTAPNPFLPVLIKAREGGAWLKWTSEAAEFELSGLSAGTYRVCSLNYFGLVSFARGLIVPPAGLVELRTRLGEEIQLDEPLSREVMGIVRWENGQPVEGAVVFFQDAVNFRRFLRRVVTDRNGFFRIPGVPGGATYFSFALPPQDEHAMKQLVYPRVESKRRETWFDLSISPHKIIGQLAGGGLKTRFDLVRKEAGDRELVVWSVRADKDGRFEVANVPHGRYVVRAGKDGSPATVTSLSFEVEKDLVVVVRWPPLVSRLPTSP